MEIRTRRSIISPQTSTDNEDFEPKVGRPPSWRAPSRGCQSSGSLSELNYELPVLFILWESVLHQKMNMHPILLRHCKVNGFQNIILPPGSFLQQDPCAYIFFFLKWHHPETAFIKFSPADSWITLGKEKGILFSSMEDFWEDLLCVCQYIRSRLWCVVEVTVLPLKSDLVPVIENILQLPCNSLGVQKFITHLISIANYKFPDA